MEQAMQRGGITQEMRVPLFAPPAPRPSRLADLLRFVAIAGFVGLVALVAVAAPYAVG